MSEASVAVAGPYDPETVPKSRRERRHGRRRSEILRATAIVVAEQGYHRASLDQIAERLDLSKASLYHYFPSKDAVVRECLDTCARYVTTRLRLIVARRGGTARARLQAMIEQQLTLTTRTYPELSRLFLQQLDWPRPLAERVARLERQHDRLFRRVLDDGVRAGEFEATAMRNGRILMYAVLRDLPQWLAAHGGTLTLEEIAESLMRLFPAPSRQRKRA